MSAELHRWAIPHGWWSLANHWEWLPARLARSVLVIMSPAVVISGACLGPMIFGPVVPAGADIYGFFFQVGLQLRQAYTTGELPFWTPNSLSGAPFLADPQSAVFYPPNVLLYGLLSAADAIRATFLLHILAAYLGTYAFLRSVGLGRPAALYGALSYAFSGYLLLRLAGPALLMVTSLLPVLFFLGHQALRADARSHRLLYVGAFAAGVALDVLVGFAQTTYYSLLAVSAYMAAMALDRHKHVSPRGLVSYARTLVVRLGLPMLIGVAVCAVQLLPSLEFVRSTDRAALGGTPGIPVGQTIDGLTKSSVWAFLGAGPGEGEQRTFYTGALGLALAPLALVLRPNRQSLFFGATAILTLLLATETRNPIRNLASLAIPGWTAFEDHYPTRALVYVVFCLAVLAAFALDRPVRTMRWLPILAALEMSAILVLLGRWQSGPTPALLMQLRVLATFLGVNVLLLFVWRTAWLRSHARRLAVPSMVAVLIADLAFHYQTLGITYARLPEFFGPSAAAEFVVSQSTAPSRFLSMTRPGVPPYQDLLNASTLLSANAGVVYGLEDAQGYNPLQLRRYREFLSAVNSPIAVDYHLGSVLNPFSPLVRYLNVRFLVTDPSVPLTARLAGPTELTAGRLGATVHTSARTLRGLVVDSTLANSVSVPQGTPVGAIVVEGSDGTSTRLTVRAGIETAEWAYDRPDVRQSIRHNRPAVIVRDMPAGPDFQGHIYRAAFSFSQPTEIRNLRVELLAPEVNWSIDQVTADSESWRDAYESVFEGKGVRILQADEVLPRAYLTHSVEQVADGTAILARLQDPDFDPRQSVILEEPPSDSDATLGPPLTSDGRWIPSSEPEALAEAADVQAGDPNRLKIRVRAQRPAMLVLSETFYSAWRAYVDGRPAHTYRANYLFRAVAIPPGEHQVEMRYESAAFQAGLLVSGGTLVVALMAGCWLWVYARRRSREEVVRN